MISNQSILKDINPEYSLEGLMLKLKLQYFGHLMWRADSLEKTLMLGKTEDRRRRGQQRIKWLDGIMDSMDMSLSKLGEIVSTGKPGVLQSKGSQSWTRLNNNNNFNEIVKNMGSGGGEMAGWSLASPLPSEGITYIPQTFFFLICKIKITIALFWGLM